MGAHFYAERKGFEPLLKGLYFKGASAVSMPIGHRIGHFRKQSKIIKWYDKDTKLPPDIQVGRRQR